MYHKFTEGEIENSLEFQNDIGVDEFLVQKLQQDLAVTRQPVAQQGLPCSVHDTINLARAAADAAQNLTELQQMVEQFDGCGLKIGATHTVFARGNSHAHVMLIGEAPGEKEDVQGIPFCGESGKLLDNMLASIGINRDNDIYISNMLFWRPPGNRKPTEEELDICLPFVEKHIALVHPKVLILAGHTPASRLVSKNVLMRDLRSKQHSYHNRYLQNPVDTFVIFHPSYLLRQGSQKKDTWFDLLRIKKHMETI